MKIDSADISRSPNTNPLFSPTAKPFPEDKLPVAVWDENPELIALWNDAWRIGWKHVYDSSTMPFSPYLGEGCGTNRVWIWDTCFMTFWGAYAHQVFPVRNTLDNFYAILKSGMSDIKIHHPDNPPLFGWAELELYRHTGDLERVVELIKSGVLQDFYFWRENETNPGERMPWGQCIVELKRQKDGYQWGSNPCGMDNTPRGRGDYSSILWVDALAQQGLFAENIAQLCEIAGEQEEAQKFYAEYENKKALMQKYFDPEDGCFYDRYFVQNDEGEFCKVLTPASFWPVFAGMATAEQAESMVKMLLDPQKLGGPVACPSVSRDDPDFDPRGGYWRGGVWLPVFYMTMKALDRIGEFALARKLSLQFLHWMKDCYDQVDPHSIWECYSPTEPLPSSSKSYAFCRLDFCGWSALAPISLLIEDVIGVRSLDSAGMSIVWYPPESRGRCGIRNLQLGKGTISLVAQDGVAEISTDCTFTLDLHGKQYELTPGTHRLPVIR